MQASLESLHLLNALRSGDKHFLQSHLTPATLMLACQVAEIPTTQFLLSEMDVNTQDSTGNSCLHVAAQNGRLVLIRLLMERDIDDSLRNKANEVALDLSRSPEVSAELQRYRAVYVEKVNLEYTDLLMSQKSSELASLLATPRAKSSIELDQPLPLHLAIKFGNKELARVLVTNGADIFVRDRQGKSPMDLAPASFQDIIKKGSVEGIKGGNLASTRISGYLKKWTNYSGGWKLRWVQLENGVLGYYKNQDDVGRACRGSINMKVASIDKVQHKHDKDRFEFKVLGKGSSGFHFRANHQVEGRRWVWAITNAIEAAKTEARRRKDTEEDGSATVSLKRVDSVASFEDDEEMTEGSEEPHHEKYQLTTHSVALQVDVLERLMNSYSSNPELIGALHEVKKTVSELIKMSGDREVFFLARIDRELEVRRMWEDNMQKVAEEQDNMEEIVRSAEQDRKEARRIIRSSKTTPALVQTPSLQRNRSVYTDDGSDEEFFDAVDAGEVQVKDMRTVPVSESIKKSPATDKDNPIASSFVGYEDPLRTTLSVVDDRPKVGLWSILKSMIGKDMTKMTLPVSFNEPTSLLQRAAEDMEYSELLDIASHRADSTERMLYVAAFAASEYSSTTLRVAKPFNPLLGETFEYCRPDKGYRFLDEQVSHHPPVSAVWAESPRWTFCGESAVKSKFYGKSFEFQFPTPWYMTLRPNEDKEELYTWKKVNTSVVGIITGSPTVDNYGEMKVENHLTGDICTLTFKQRGWRGSSAFEVNGSVKDKEGTVKWILGGHWNDKIYARRASGGKAADVGDTKHALLVWQTNDRPAAPFNLTPFATTLNAVPEKLQPYLPPTDTRLRPDQRAMEDARYDLAASEKNRVEEKQRSKRKQREIDGEVWKPRWFVRAKHPVTGEEYWKSTGEYWKARERKDWSKVEGIF